MIKRRFEFSFGQLIFLVVLISTISVLTFLLGIEVGRLLRLTEETKAVTSNLNSKVTISLESYSTILRQRRVNNETTTSKEVSKEVEKPQITSKASTKSEDVADTQNLVQIGAYKEKSSYVEIEKRLNSLGFKTKVVDGKLKRLLVVVDTKKEKTEEVIAKLEKEGIKGIVVKK